VHIGEDIPAFQERIKQTGSVIPVHQHPVVRILGNPVQTRPNLQHAACFHVQYVIKLLFGKLTGPSDKPPGPVHSNIQCFFAFCVQIHIQQAHKGFMKRILGCPNAFPFCNPMQVFLRDGSDPLPAVLPLAVRELPDNSFRLCLNFFISRCGIMHRRGGQPVAQEMTAQLTLRRLPAAMHFLRTDPARYTGFKFMVEQQGLAVEGHQIV